MPYPHPAESYTKPLKGKAGRVSGAIHLPALHLEIIFLL